MSFRIKLNPPSDASQMMTVSHANNNDNNLEYEKHRRIMRNKKHIPSASGKTWIEHANTLDISFNKFVEWNYYQKHELIAMFYEYYYRRTKFSELLETFGRIFVIAPPHQSQFDTEMHLTILLANPQTAQNVDIRSERIHVRYRFDHASTSKHRHFHVTCMTIVVFDKTCQPYVKTFENI